ncbi:plasmid stabilization system protein ParE [Neorhizobium galegae]|uniref:hypothetical protein n=1 Tax=Neorhizobium galegae TaxID=399 RepID=UPI00278A2B97|nr:hypothetical protein [Neorhizobium galegae]MDQ0133210.1 plasmid stabilization system protein ParE [Neorhizobium galegae]
MILRVLISAGSLTIAMASALPQTGNPPQRHRAGLEARGYRRKATIAFRVDENTVTIARILYGGKSLGGAGDIEDEL